MRAWLKGVTVSVDGTAKFWTSLASQFRRF